METPNHPCIVFTPRLMRRFFQVHQSGTYCWDRTPTRQTCPVTPFSPFFLCCSIPRMRRFLNLYADLMPIIHYVSTCFRFFSFSRVLWSMKNVEYSSIKKSSVIGLIASNQLYNSIIVVSGRAEINIHWGESTLQDSVQAKSATSGRAKATCQKSARVTISNVEELALLWGVYFIPPPVNRYIYLMLCILLFCWTGWLTRGRIIRVSWPTLFSRGQAIFCSSRVGSTHRTRWTSK